MAGFSSLQEDFDRIFFKEHELIDQFIGEQLLGYGLNQYGELGDNTATSKTSPVTTVAGGTNWKSVSCGRDHTAAIKTDGTLWVWGRNERGQLGNVNFLNNYSSPVTTAAGGTNWKSVSSGYKMTAAIKTDGTLWVCGYNLYGQLGTNNNSSYSSPVTTAAGGTNWKSVSCYNHTAAIKTDGTLWTWGYNVSGQLGTNDTTSRSSPVQTVAGGTNWKQVSVGYNHMVAIKTDGTLWTWGGNNFGQLGTNNTTSYSSPVTTTGTNDTNWKTVSCGNFFTAAIKTDGTLWVWGYSGFGQLGTNNTTNDRSSPVTTVAGGTNWKSVSSGYRHTAAIKTDGTLWTWGYNLNGQLGTNNTTSYSSPITTAAGGTNWKQVSCGYLHTAAIGD